MTRAEFTTLLISSMSLTPSDAASKSFSDTGTHWAKAYINEAVKQGILIPSEYPNGLQPDASIKRSEVCAMLMRALSQPQGSGSTNFKDQGTINQSMYKGYIKGAVDLGLISGYTDGTFNPFGNMKRGEICRVVSVFLSKLPGSSTTATPSAGKTIDKFTHNDYGYTAYYVKMYLNYSSDELYLSDMIISDEDTVVIKGQSYDLGSNKVSIDLSGTYYDIKQLDLSGDEIVMVLAETERLFASDMDYNDISKIYIDDDLQDIDDISSIEFIFDGNRKDLQDVTINGSGEFLLGSLSIPASQITMVIDDSCYQLEQVSMNDSGDFVFYCEEDGIDEWVEVNDKYYDARHIQIVYDDEEYDMDDIMVVDRNEIRIGGKQRSVNGSFKLKIDGLLYSIEKVDEGDEICIGEFETNTRSFSGGEPAGYVFYNEETVCYDGDLDAVSILAGGTWVGFDQVSITNPSYFSYEGETYSLLDARIQINAVEFEVSDALWHAKSQVLDLIMKAV